MSNPTKKQKEELISKISKLEKYLKNQSDPDNNLPILDELKQYILHESYGLVFEDHIEDISDIENFELAEITDLCIDNGENENIIIEGKNLIALYLLMEDYRGRVDAICIDPPYNTGMDWLNYGDHNYVDDDDSYSHSKWLSFMNIRLRIAYKLLSDKGVMFINLDETETGTLLLLCQQLFGENNVDVIIWPKTDPRFDQNRVEKPFRDIKITHEYVFACFKNRENTNLKDIMIPVLKNGEWRDMPGTLETIIKGLGTTSSAKDELGEIFGDRLIFQTPKPMRLIKELVRSATAKDSLVLDFFAGSGTTGHAVMDLNKEDSGSRKFILINNNENNICKDITYERLKRVIQIENYSEDLQYLKISP